MKNSSNSLFILFILMVCLPCWSAQKFVFNVRQFGAKGDGVRMDTRPIQAAIDKAALKGGEVVFPPGQYLCGTLFMKNRVTLRLSESATLLGSPRLSDYPEIKSPIPSYADIWLRYSLIYAQDCQDIAIIGPGMIDGQGAQFPVVAKERPDRYKQRPYIIRMIGCKNIRVENIKLQNSPMWMQHYFACENLTLHGLNVINHCNKNNDMMDIDGCQNVLISDCIGDTDDDGITLKSTSDRVTENVTINNCIISSHCNAIKCGTESHGGFKNIVVSNVVIKPSQHPDKISGEMIGISGIALEIVDGGQMDGVQVANVHITGTLVPIFIRLGDRGRIYKEGLPRPAPGTLRNISISHVSGIDAGAIGCSITGLPGHPIEGIAMHDIRIQFRGGWVHQDSVWTVPEKPEDYPEATMFGNLPSYGFYIRHVQGISMQQVDLDYADPDSRPALIADDVSGLDIIGFRGRGQSHLLELVNSRQVLLMACRALSPTPTLARVLGSGSREIQITGALLANIDRLIELGPEVVAGAITLTTEKTPPSIQEQERSR